MKKIVILSAGRTHTGTLPNIIFKQNKYFNNFEIFKNVFKKYTNDFTIITGYKSKFIEKKISANIIKNKYWKTTKNVFSFFSVDLNKYEEVIVVYGDVIFKKNVLEELLISKKDVTFFYSNFVDDYKKKKEYLKVNKQKLIKLGTNLTSKEANGEFVGVIKFNKKALDILKNIKENRIFDYSKMQMSDLIHVLRGYDLSLKYIDISRKWLEFKFNEKHLRRYLFSTKADTLAFGKKFIKKSIILDQFTFTVNDWIKSKAKILNQAKNYKSIIIRSSTIDEDSFENSKAGSYLSINNVSTKKNFVNKINRVIKSFESKNLQNQVLIQPSAKDIICNGVIFTTNLGNQLPTYKINLDYKGEDTSSITSGKSKNDKTFFISKYNLNLKKIKNLHLRKIVAASAEIEDVFLCKHLDIEFAINKNNEIIIFQVRPLVLKEKTEYTEKVFLSNYKKCLKKWDKDLKSIKYKKYLTPLLGVMPDWNPAEIIGFKPKILAASLYEELITKNIWAKQRDEFGYKKVNKSNLLYNLLGTYYVNVNKTLHSFLPKNTSKKTEKKFLKFYNKELSNNKFLHDKIEFELIPTCYSISFSEWKKKLEKNKFFPSEILQLENGLKKINYNIFNIYDSSIRKIKNLNKNYKNIINKNINESQKIKELIKECKKNGTLPFAHFARIAFISITLLKDGVKSNILSQKAYDQLMLSISTINKKMINDAYLAKLDNEKRKTFFREYGHLRPGTYDVTSNNYSDNKNEILNDIIRGSKKINSAQPTLWIKEKNFFFNHLIKKKIFLIKNHDEIEKIIINSIELRELSKFFFTKYINKIIKTTLILGKKYSLNRDEVAYLNIRDFLKSHKKTMKLKNKIKNNIKQYQLNKEFELPSIITSKEDILSFEMEKSQPNYICRNKVISKIELVKKFKKYNNELKGKIILIESADPGFDWIFNKKISGLITKFGGANSHMAIRTSELNIPAAIGVGELRFNQIKNSSIVKLDPLNKILCTIK